jgi:hypothetical protein
VVAPYTAGEILFGQAMTRPAITGRYQGGARIVTSSAGGALPAGQELLFLVRADGQLAAVTQTDTPTPLPGDTIVSLAPAPAPPADRDRPGLPEASDDELSPTPDRPA